MITAGSFADMRRWLDNNRGFLVFVLCLGFFRTAIADWNPIPSGSMRPTLLEGDVVLVDRIAYDLKIPLTNVSLATFSDPQRGDVVTFHSPRDETRLIKRVVGLPGDSVEMRNKVLYINNVAADYLGGNRVTERVGDRAGVPALRTTERIAGSSRAVQFLKYGGAGETFGPVVVPPGHYFMLGDNRDNSVDSRFIGFVPRNLIIGHAHRILVSADITGNWMPRGERIIRPIR